MNERKIKQLAIVVADRLAANAREATHPNFVFALNAALEERGLRLEAEQRGVQGTYLRIARTSRVRAEARAGDTHSRHF